MVNRHFGGSITIFFFGGGQDWHKCLTEGPFCEEPAKQIWNSKGHIEGIGQGTGAKSGGNEQFPEQTRDAGSQGPERDGGGGLKEAHGESVATPCGALCQQWPSKSLDESKFRLIQ